MEEKIKIKLAVGSLSSVFILLGFVLFRVLSVSTEFVIKYPLTTFENFISLSASHGPSEAIINSFTEPFMLFSPLIPIILGLCVLVFYTVKIGNDRRFCTLVALVPSVAGLIFLGISLTSVLFSLSLIISGYFICPLSIMYLKELTRWKRYRIGSKTIAKCFFLVNLLVFFGLMGSVILNINHYNSIYVSNARDIIFSVVPDIGTGVMPEIEGFELLPDEQKQEIMDEYSRMTEAQKQEINTRIDEMFETGNISALINICILFIPLMVFAFLELFRVVVLSPLSGLVTRIILYNYKIK